jgi:predicted transglutaminase-like cysteine proteinase
VAALSDDVLFYRCNVVLDSAKPNLVSLARSYRTYLQVCISLIDAFLSHATFALGECLPAARASEHFSKLQSHARLTERLEAWCSLWEQSPAALRATKSWSDLEKIRQERNRYVHPAEPMYSLGIDEIVRVLNCCRDGVGGILEHLRNVAGLDPRLSYIQKIKTSPIIEETK